MFTLYKMTFYLKFLSLTVKVGQNKNKIGDKKKKKNYNELTNRIIIIVEEIS